MKLKSLHLLPFALLLSAVLSSCGRHDVVGDKVYYVYWNEANGKNTILIKGADAESFEELDHADYALFHR